jgi:hypothetical protein
VFCVGDTEVTGLLLRDCLLGIGNPKVGDPLPAAILLLHQFYGKQSGIPEAGAVCAYWRILARNAFNAPYLCDYVVLLGDDVELLDVGWQQAVVHAYTAIAKQVFPMHLLPSAHASCPVCECLRRTPGFGVVALCDVTMLGFPSFPTISRLHYQIFCGSGDGVPCEGFPAASSMAAHANPPDIFPKRFKNRADPFLFALYRRFGSACYLHSHRLQNNIGGSSPARYSKQSVPWSFGPLDGATATVEAWLVAHGTCGARRAILDVAIPSAAATPSICGPCCGWWKMRHQIKAPSSQQLMSTRASLLV